MPVASSKISIGSNAPNFSLPDMVSGKTYTLTDLKGQTATVVMFICNHCPYVKHVNIELVKLANEYISQGIAFIAISSNDVAKYPEDGPEKMKETAGRLNYPFPYLYDETQDIARAYDAVCTPEFFVYDNKLKLAYHGQLDDSRPGSGIPVTGKDLRSALNSIGSEALNSTQKPSIGCSIKWK